jgi:dTMP kinase
VSYFFVFDGVDGAGKSTQIKMAADFLTGMGFDVVQTREPGGTPMAEEIRGVMLSPRSEKVDPNTEMLLAYAARQQHLTERIIPELEAGKIVLCDRFSSSTYAYQVCGNGADKDLFGSLEESIIHGIASPTGYILFDLDPEVSAQRVDSRGAKDRIEKNEEDFFERARSGYQEFFRKQESRSPGSVKMIDANGSISEIKSLVEAGLSELLQSSPQKRLAIKKRNDKALTMG